MTEETQEYRGGGEDNSAAGDGEERQQQAVDMGSGHHPHPRRRPSIL